MQLQVNYPSQEEEIRIHALTQADLWFPLILFGRLSVWCKIQNLVGQVAVDQGLVESAVKLVRQSRPGDDAPELVRDHLRWGAGPRAS